MIILSPSLPAMMSFLEPQVKQGFQFRNVDEVIINNVRISGQDGEDYLFENVPKIVKK